jgi:3D (Asp-Asp-Asp) domain-containing protein
LGCCLPPGYCGWSYLPQKRNMWRSKNPFLRQETPQEAAYTHKSTMTVTAYCPCEKCCGAYSNGYTATGVKATQGVTIATDPDVIPMGTEVEIDGHIYIAQDVGGAISGNRIDLYFDSHEDALQWGVREKIVRWAG